GRGETIQPLEFFPALHGAFFLLIHPRFGIATAWAYQQLSQFPAALNGKPGRAQELILMLERESLNGTDGHLYNSLEAPALKKYPLLALFQEFLRANGAAVALISGSGSTTFALVQNERTAENLAEKLKEKFGEKNWLRVIPTETKGQNRGGD